MNEKTLFSPTDLELLEIALGGASIHDLVDLLGQNGFLSEKVKEEVKRFEESMGQSDNPQPPVAELLYANGERVSYTNADEFLKAFKEELPFFSKTGLSCKIHTADPHVRKAVDDEIFNLFGEDNPRQLEDYEGDLALHVEALPAKSAKERLAEKIKANFEEFKEKWLSLSPEQLITRCDEVEAVTRMAHDGARSVNEEDAVFLLRFKNPLDVISDQWVCRNGMGSLIIDDELRDILWSLRERDDLDVYELEEEPIGENPSQTM